MLHSRTLIRKINRLYERALRFVYFDYKSSFNTLLEKDGSFSIQLKYKYKFLQDLSPAIIDDIIKINRSPTWNLRNCQELYSINPKTVRHDTETISLLALKTWQ